MPRRFKRAVHAVDSSTIRLVVNCIDWARHRRRKAAAKLHLRLDLQCFMPAFAIVDTAAHNDNKRARELCAGLKAGEIVLFDKAYVDYSHLYDLTMRGVFWVTRTKDNMQYRVKKRLLKKSAGKILRDDLIVLTGPASREKYPSVLRRVRAVVEVDGQEREMEFLTNNLEWAASSIAELYRSRWQIGVSRQGHIVQSVKDRPRPKDSGLVAGEASWRETKTAEPSDNMLGKEYAQRTRLQRAVNADVASLHEFPVAETVDNVRKQQELAETSPMRQFSPAGYQRRHGVKDDVATGEALGARRRKLAEEMPAITVSGKCGQRRQGGGSGRITDEGRAAKRARREGPGPVSIPLVKVRQG